jgi:hypothetical protein
MTRKPFPERLKIKTLPTLLAVLHQSEPIRDVFQQDSGRFMVSFDLFPVRGTVVREAIASGAIVETYPGKNAPYWRVPEFVEKPRRRHDFDDLRRRIDSLSGEERRQAERDLARLTALLPAY